MVSVTKPNGEIIKVSQLVSDFPEIVELDLNPVFATRKDAIAADVRVSDLSEGAEPATFEIDLWADPVLDVLREDYLRTARTAYLEFASASAWSVVDATATTDVLVTRILDVLDR